MEYNIEQITAPEEKGAICSTILHALPSWFGVEASIIDYTETTQAMPFWAAYDGDRPIGFVALKLHNPHAAEVCVLGILKELHRHGIGRRLIECCEQFCRERDIEFLTVKTLDASAQSRSYEKTRSFYLAMDFRPLEVFPLHWDEANPCLFMAKYLPAAE